MVALGHAMLRTTHRSWYEKQPLVDVDAGLCPTLGGRVISARNLQRPWKKDCSSFKC